jgi:hypothetical protein
MVLNKGHNLPLICNEDILIKGGAHNGGTWSTWSPNKGIGADWGTINMVLNKGRG